MIRKSINYLFNWTASLTLYVISVAILNILLKEMQLKYEWIEYILHFGLGVLLYFPIKLILKHGQDKNTKRTYKDYIKTEVVSKFEEGDIICAKYNFDNELFLFFKATDTDVDLFSGKGKLYYKLIV